MAVSLKNMSRRLSPVEHLVLKAVCSGQSNLCISERTHYSIKTVENTISRSARVFGVMSGPDINLRVLLAVAYRVNFGDSETQMKNLDVKEVPVLDPAA